MYLSKDSQLDDDDLPIGDCFLPPVPSGASGQCFDFAARLPDASVAPVGPYFWIACSDSLEQTLESDEGDNCEASYFHVPEPGFPAALLPAVLALIAGGRIRRDKNVD